MSWLSTNALTAGCVCNTVKDLMSYELTCARIGDTPAAGCVLTITKRNEDFLALPSAADIEESNVDIIDREVTQDDTDTRETRPTTATDIDHLEDLTVSHGAMPQPKKHRRFRKLYHRSIRQRKQKPTMADSEEKVAVKEDLSGEERIKEERSQEGRSQEENPVTERGNGFSTYCKVDEPYSSADEEVAAEASANKALTLECVEGVKSLSSPTEYDLNALDEGSGCAGDLGTREHRSVASDEDIAYESEAQVPRSSSVEVCTDTHDLQPVVEMAVEEVDATPLPSHAPVDVSSQCPETPQRCGAMINSPGSEVLKRFQTGAKEIDKLTAPLPASALPVQVRFEACKNALKGKANVNQVDVETEYLTRQADHVYLYSGTSSITSNSDLDMTDVCQTGQNINQRGLGHLVESPSPSQAPSMLSRIGSEDATSFPPQTIEKVEAFLGDLVESAELPVWKNLLTNVTFDELSGAPSLTKMGMPAGAVVAAQHTTFAAFGPTVKCCATRLAEEITKRNRRGVTSLEEEVRKACWLPGVTILNTEFFTKFFFEPPHHQRLRVRQSVLLGYWPLLSRLHRSTDENDINVRCCFVGSYCLLIATQKINRNDKLVIREENGKGREAKLTHALNSIPHLVTLKGSSQLKILPALVEGYTLAIRRRPIIIEEAMALANALADYLAPIDPQESEAWRRRSNQLNLKKFPARSFAGR